jgi:hypothetical protein
MDVEVCSIVINRQNQLMNIHLVLRIFRIRWRWCAFIQPVHRGKCIVLQYTLLVDGGFFVIFRCYLGCLGILRGDSPVDIDSWSLVMSPNRDAHGFHSGIVKL